MAAPLLDAVAEAASLPERDRATVVSLVRYRGYLEREAREADRLRRSEGIAVPDGFSFDGLPGLSNELQERLRQVRPTSLGQASRIPGMTPAAVGLLAAALDRRRKGLS